MKEKLLIDYILDLEDQLREIEKNYNDVKRVLIFTKQHYHDKIDNKLKNISITEKSDEFKNLFLSEAILKVLEKNQTPCTVKQIYSELLLKGIKTKSEKSLKNSTYQVLYRLQEDKKIIRNEKRWSLNIN